MSRTCLLAGCVPLLAALFLIVVNAPTSTTAQESNFTYFVYVTERVRPGFDIVLSVSIRNSENDVNVSAHFHSLDNAVSFQNSVVVANNATTRLVLGKIPLDYSGSRDFNFSVAGFDVNEPDRIIFVDGTRDFYFFSKTVSLLIQTDKAIYQPGQTIKFRAVCLTPDLRPVRGSVSYQVQDPKGNVVLLEPNVTLTNGVAGGEISLTRQAAQGGWNITFQYLKFKESVSVEIYKLPRIQVEVDCAQFIYAYSPGITITLKATYKSGQPVYGRGKLSLKGYGRSRRIIKYIPNFTGNEKIFVSVDELIYLYHTRREFFYGTTVVLGKVTEGFTGLKYKGRTEFRSEQFKYFMNKLHVPIVVKPGFPYQALIQVTEQDGSLLMEADRKNERTSFIVTANYRFKPFPADYADSGYYYDFDDLHQTETYVFEVPPNGLISVDITMPLRPLYDVWFTAAINATMGHEFPYDDWRAESARSPSNSFIQITPSSSTAEGDVTVGDTAQFLIRTTEEVSSIRILILSKGVILVDEEQFLPTPSSKQLSYSFLVTQEMNPSIYLLAFYIRDDNEIVADYVRFDFAFSLENQVNISVSDDSVDAGTEVNIQVQTSSPGSYVGIRAIDKSVLFLKSDNDITRERVVEEVKDYSYVKSEQYNKKPFPFFSWYPLPFETHVTSRIFENAEIIALTNTTIYMDGYYFDSGSEWHADIPELSRFRSGFPETWLWDDAITETDGLATFNAVAPDTITSWIISAFSLSEESGLGIADTYRLTVFRRFFVSLNLPLRVTRGEVAIVQATIFNYFDRPLRVAVRFHANDQKDKLSLIRPAMVRGTQNRQLRVFQIPSNSSISVKYPVHFKAIGEVPLKVTAVSNFTIDAVERKVFVRPEGIQRCYTTSTLLNLNENNQAENSLNEVEENLIVTIPDGIVQGSSNVLLGVYGNILGSSLNNLGRLLKVPGGCGEQNMINFAPDVFVTLYWQRSKELDAEIRSTAFKYMDGYMNELNYKRRDGSFSAFGDRDESGSTWLTAFVTKCFLFANKLQPTLVEPSVINRAIDFLVNQQDRNGEFIEPGRVIHREMQGGVNSPITMTAYVLIALTETDYIGTSNANGTTNATSLTILQSQAYLERNFNQTLNDIYALSLVTYALQLTGSSLTDYALNQLEDRAEMEGGKRYWHIPSTDTSSYASRWRPPYRAASSNDIEMTSYVLLTYINRNDIDNAIPILKWLVSKQNELGGYSSTQDTVLALQALSEMASLLSGKNQNLMLSITLLDDKNYSQDLTITDENSIVYNSLSVPNRNDTISIRASGSGIGIAQLSVCYNIMSDPYEEEPFNCTVEVTSSDKDNVNVEFCCSLNENSEPTGMFLFEVGLLSGFTADLKMMKEINPMAKLVELDGDSLNVYYDELIPDRRLCAVVDLYREHDVASLRPATVNAFDYYKPERKVTLLYNDEGLSNAEVCQICGSECAGCLPIELRVLSEWTPCNDYCGNEMSTRNRVCYDPNFQAAVLPIRCGLTKTTTESRSCNLTLSCPDSSRYLWIELPSNIIRYNRNICYFEQFQSYEDPDTTWSIARSSATGIPGQIVDGAENIFRCENIFPLYYKILDIRSLTVSLLINPSSFEANSRSVFLSIAINSYDSLVRLVKDPRSDSLVLFLSTVDKLYKVNNIPLLPIGQWSHIVITWNSNKTAQVYINGTSVGNSSVVEGGYLYPPSYTQTLLIGTSPSNNRDLQGFPNATFSSFKLWKTELPEDQRNTLIQFYQDLLSYTDDDPVFTVPQLRSFIPEDYYCCINSPSSLSAIYSDLISCVIKSVAYC